MKIKEILKGIEKSVKIFIIVIIINFICYSYINHFLIPDEKNATTRISEIDNLISANFDIVTKQYKDLQYVKKLQKEAINIQYDLQKTKTIKVFSISFLLITIVGILAWWLQYVYTDMDFKNNEKISYNVLAIALLSSAIIVGLVYYVSMS